MKKNVLVFTLFMSMAVAVFAQSESDFEVKEEGGKITITKYKGTVKDVKIPERINGLPVTIIGRMAFYDRQLTSVVIPNSVTSIEAWAFHSNQLTNVIIPNSVTSIGELAFISNRLISVTIPNSVTYIGQQAFQYNRLTSVTIPDSAVTIWGMAFGYNQLTSVTIPNSVTFIGEETFRDNQLTSVTLPDNVNINAASFDYYSIYTQYIKNGKKQHTFTISPPATIGFYEIVTVDNAFVEILKYNGNEKDVRIPERINGLPVIAIGDQAFKDNQLTSVTIPNSITAIGAHTFQGNRLTSIIIPNSISFIGNNAFRRNQLTSVTIPNAVTIGGSAFASNSITSITIGANVTLEQGAIGGLESAYNNGGKRAATYTLNTSTNSWTVQYR